MNTIAEREPVARGVGYDCPAHSHALVRIHRCGGELWHQAWACREGCLWERGHINSFDVTWQRGNDALRAHLSAEMTAALAAALDDVLGGVA